MINVSITPRSPGRWYHFFRGQPLQWARTDSVGQVIQRGLAMPSTMGHIVAASGDFPDIFNVVDMKNIVGFKVMWTNNLADHLVVRGRFVYLFSQITALKRLGSSGTSRHLLPPASSKKS
ncbi:hypothetical protein VTJ83DRAFT_222 [Remersonia thermophila]|uniref:Uncharacterized protein n=1 Tax=Remersonia thermophila TaxID=72144 RepID=A0ABR4DKS5_9PEZI